MLKLRFSKLIAIIITITIIIEAMPAESVKAFSNVAQKIMFTVIEPSMVYRDVYGFFNGYARVVSEDDKIGLIDTSGREVIPAGKYRQILISKDINSLIIIDNTNHAYIMDYNENIKHDLGICESIELWEEYDSAIKKNVKRIHVYTENTVKKYSTEGSLVSEEDIKTLDNSIIKEQIMSKGTYSDVGYLGQLRNRNYFKAKSNYNTESELFSFTIFDDSANECFTIDNVNSYRTYGDGFISFNIQSLESSTEEYQNKLYSYDGNLILYNLTNIENITPHYSCDSIIIRFTEEKCWREYDTYGNVIGVYDNYDNITPINYNIINEEDTVICSYNVYNENGQYDNRHYYIVNNKRGTKIDIGCSYYYNILQLNNGLNCISLHYSQGSYDSTGYKMIDFNGNLVFDSSQYKDRYNNVIYDGRYVMAYDIQRLNEDNIYYNYDVYNFNGTLVYSIGDCKYVNIFDNNIVVTRLNDVIEVYDNNYNLIYKYDSNMYSELEYEYNGFIPFRGSNGMWGIAKLIDNPYYSSHNKDNTTMPTQTPIPRPDSITPDNNLQNYTQDYKTQDSNNTQDNTSTSIKKPAIVKKIKVYRGKKKTILVFPKLSNGVKGYKLEYSLNKNFNNTKHIVFNDKKVTLRKLKSGKVYYIRVKAYKLDGRKKVYSKKWSVIKHFKAK